MKKTLLTIITLFSLFLTLSCSQEIQFRESVIQASVNGQLWLTDEVRVYVLTEKFGGKDVPYYFIEGVKDNQTLTLRTTGLAKSTYPLGNNNSKTAHLINIGETGILEFKTGTAYPGSSGAIIIEKYDSENQTISGKFKFKALNTNIKDTINPNIIFENGIFHNIPVY